MLHSFLSTYDIAQGALGISADITQSITRFLTTTVLYCILSRHIGTTPCREAEKGLSHSRDLFRR